MAKGHKKTTSVTADKATTGMQNSVYDAARKAAEGYNVVGADPNTTAAMSLFGDLGGYGRTGAAALAGDADATSKMMNPYMQQVMDAYRAEFGNSSDMLRKNVNSAATSAGAFGGDRAALEQGAMQGELGRAYGGQVADLLRGGYNDMISRAGGLANLGLTAGGQQFAGGQYMRDVAMEQANPDVMRAQILGQGLQTGNVGNKTTTDYTKTSALQNILGGAATIGGLFAGGGGGGGALAGLFGGGGGASLMSKFGDNFSGGLFGGQQLNPFGASGGSGVFAGQKLNPFGANAGGGLFGGFQPQNLRPRR